MDSACGFLLLLLLFWLWPVGSSNKRSEEESEVMMLGRKESEVRVLVALEPSQWVSLGLDVSL